MSLLNMEKINFAFGSTDILKNLDFKVEKGQLVALLGMSGSGKTTLLRLIAGLERLSSGKIFLRGENVCGESYVECSERGVGFVFQDFALFEHLTVYENIKYGCKNDHQKKCAKKMIDLFSLDSHLNKKPRSLSGGEKQRVALARSLALEPDIILLDEPFASIDRQHTQKFVYELREIFKKLRVTGVMVTHAIEEAIDFADRIHILDQGKVLQSGTVKEIFVEPINEFVKEFTGGGYIIRGEVHDSILQSPLGNIPVEKTIKNGEVEILVRANGVKILAE